MMLQEPLQNLKYPFKLQVPLKILTHPLKLEVSFNTFRTSQNPKPEKDKQSRIAHEVRLQDEAWLVQEGTLSRSWRKKPLVPKQ